MLTVIEKISATKTKYSCFECQQEYIGNPYDIKRSRIGHLCKDCHTFPTGQMTQELLKKFLNYDPLSGLITCKIIRKQNDIGDVLGTIAKTGYLVIGLGCKVYLAHRLIWLYMTGELPEQIDHINHIRLDNRWVNLREVCNTTNAKNCTTSKNSTTKINGISYIERLGKYRAYVMVDKKQIHLGVYVDIEDAIAARAAADIKYGFHGNHGN